MPLKSTTTTEWVKKEKKIQKNLQNKSKRKNNNFSWVTAVRVLSLTGSHSPPHLPRMPSNTVLISGPAVGAAQILIWSYFSLFLPPMSIAIRTSESSSVGALSDLLYIPQTQSRPSWSRGFNLQLAQLVGRLGSSSLVTLHLGFNCGFISISACGSSIGVCSWVFPGGLGFAPVRARCGGGAANGLQGLWQHQVLREVGGFGSSKYSALEVYGNQYWPTPSRVLAWKTPLPYREAWQSTVYRVTKSRTLPKQLCTHSQDFFACDFLPPQWELSMKVGQLLGLRGSWQRQVCRDKDCLCCRSYRPIRVFF